MSFFTEKRGLITIFGAIGLIAIVYFIVQYGTSSLFQGRIVSDPNSSDAPPSISFDVASTDSSANPTNTDTNTNTNTADTDTPPTLPGSDFNDANTNNQESNTDAPPEINFTGFESNTNDNQNNTPPEDNNQNNNNNNTGDDNNPPTNNNNQNPQSSIRIVSHDITPKGFNPLVSEAKIDYEISARAKIEIRILDEYGSKVVTLVDNEILDAGDYQVWWNGTDKTTSNGDVVDPGKYYYKIYAKDPSTSEVADTESGSVNAIYAQTTQDFENTPQTSTPTTTTTSTYTNQNAATVAVQNATSGRTSETGPEAAIYLILPLVGYFLTRKKNHARK